MRIEIRKRGLTAGNHSQSYYAYILLLSTFIFRGSMWTYITAFVNKLPVIGHVGFMVVPVLMVSFAILAHKRKLFAYYKQRDMLIVPFFVIGILVTMICYPQNEPYMWSNFSNYIVFCIPAFFVGLCSVEYDEDMFAAISQLSCVSIVMSYLLLFYYSTLGSYRLYDELGQSYAVLPCTLFVMGYYAYRKQLVYLVFSGIGAFYALMLGSRGPIVLICVFVIFCVLFTNRKRLPLFIGLMAIVLIFVYSGAYTDIMVSLRQFMVSHGYSYRIIDFLLTNQLLSYTSQRGDIYVLLLGLLKERPLIGYGWFGEWPYVKWNAHEIYLEVVFEYGYPLGIVMIVTYVSKVLTTLFKEKDDVQKYFILVYVVFVLCQGVMSYSHLRPELFLLLGFCLRRRRELMQIEMADSKQNLIS